MLYLVHDGFKDKYQYDIDEVFGDLKTRLQKLLVDEDEESRVLRIVDIIDNCPTSSYRDLLIKVCEAGLYGEFRRLGVGVKYLLEEKKEHEIFARYADK